MSFYYINVETIVKRNSNMKKISNPANEFCHTGSYTMKKYTSPANGFLLDRYSEKMYMTS